MILLFRLYKKSDITEKEFNKVIDKRRRERYITYLNDKLKEFKISDLINENKYIQINNKYYYRSDKDVTDNLFLTICDNLLLNNVSGQIAIKSDTKHYKLRYQNYPDLFLLFDNYKKFLDWLETSNSQIIIRHTNGYNTNINKYRSLILELIKQHFNDEGILLFKIKFDNKDKTDFFYNEYKRIL